MEKYRVTIDQRVYEVSVERIDEEQASPAPKEAAEKAPQVSNTTPKRTGFTVEAPLSGAIVSVKVKVGQKVAEGDVLLTLEALKLENEITAPRAGEIVEIVSEGAAVETGESLAVIG